MPKGAEPPKPGKLDVAIVPPPAVKAVAKPSNLKEGTVKRGGAGSGLQVRAANIPAQHSIHAISSKTRVRRLLWKAVS